MEKKKRAEQRSKENREKAVKESNIKANALMSGIFGQQMDVKIGSSIDPELEGALKLGQFHDVMFYINESTSTLFICKNRHDFKLNDAIHFSLKNISIPILAIPHKYYVSYISDDKKSFKISHTIGGPNILLQKIFDVVSVKKVGSVSQFRTNIKHNLKLGDYIEFNGASLPIPLRGKPKRYFIADISKDNLSFQISEMKGGKVILLNQEIKLVSDKITISTFEPPKSMNELLKIKNDKENGGSIMTTVQPHNFENNDYIEFDTTSLPIKPSPHRYFIIDIGKDKLTFKITEKKNGKPIEFIQEYDKFTEKIIILTYGEPKLQIIDLIKKKERVQVKLAELTRDQYTRNMQLTVGDNPKMRNMGSSMDGEKVANNSKSLNPESSKDLASGGSDVVNKSMNDPENSEASKAKDKIGDAQKDAEIPDDFKI